MDFIDEEVVDYVRRHEPCNTEKVSEIYGSWVVLRLLSEKKLTLEWDGTLTAPKSILRKRLELASLCEKYLIQFDDEEQTKQSEDFAKLLEACVRVHEAKIAPVETSSDGNIKQQVKIARAERDLISLLGFM